MSSMTLSLNHLKASNDLLRMTQAYDAKVLADIYKEYNNIVIWKRNLEGKLKAAAEDILSTHPRLEISIVTDRNEILANIKNLLGSSQTSLVLSEDIAFLVNIFCDLFELEQVGLRLTSLDHAMCPRFHVDNVPCRLITTYQGIATEWLPHDIADRSKLGTGNNGQPDENSGIFQNQEDIRYLNKGDVALLKGEAWAGNEGKGLIHRSPKLLNNSNRLILTIDFINN